MGSQCETRSWIHRRILPQPIPLTTTIASRGALQGREEVAFSPSLPLFLDLSHVTHSCSVPEKHYVCSGFSSVYERSHGTLCTVIPNKWLLPVVFMSVWFANKWYISNKFFFRLKCINQQFSLVMIARKWPFTKKKERRRLFHAFPAWLFSLVWLILFTLYFRTIIRK